MRRNAESQSSPVPDVLGPRSVESTCRGRGVRLCNRVHVDGREREARKGGAREREAQGGMDEVGGWVGE